MRFNLRVTQPKVHVLAADAFTTVYVNHSSNQLCYKEYFGPKLVIYDEQLDCIVPIKSSTFDFANDVILKPDETYCNRKQVAPNDKFWQTCRCDPMDHILEDDVVIVKHSNDENFIYCNTFKIKLYNKVEAIDCPDFVFPLSANLSFQIGRLKYKSEPIRIQNDMTFSPDLSHRINFQLMPRNKRNLDLSADMKALEELTEEIKTDSPKYVFGNYVVSGTVIVILVAVGVVLLALYWFWTKRRVPKQEETGVGTQATDEEAIELSPKEVKSKSTAGTALKQGKSKCQNR